jgi:O-antigen biosynthesis protein
MKSFLAKIGKSGKILRQEGIINGGKRIMEAWLGYLKMFQRLKPGSILFIAGGAMGDSTFYRVHVQSEELEMHGFKCEKISQDSPWLLGCADKFRIFIFHRVLYGKKVEVFINKIKKNKGIIIFETDDLVFDRKYLEFMDFYKKMNSLEKILYKNGLGGEILDDSYVDTCVTSTSYLAEKLQEKGKKVIISKNKLSNRELEIADNLLKNKSKTKDGIIRVGYFSGTMSHNKDFATISDALVKIMEKYGNVKLLLVGPLEIENKLNKFKNRIEQLPRVSRARYYENVYRADINIVPLELNPFCDSKSELKFFESGILRIPTVAVKNRTFSEAIIDGLDGFLAGNLEEWVEKLSRLIEDNNLRKAIGENAQKKAFLDYTNKNSHNEKYYNYLKKKINEII